MDSTVYPKFKPMWKVYKYTLYDLLRSKWIFIYAGFYFLTTAGLLWLSPDQNQVAISLLNILMVLAPLMAVIFGVMYYYSAKEFSLLLLAQPLKRSQIFLGEYAGLATSLSLSLLAGIVLPALVFNGGISMKILMLLLTGISLTWIFSGLSFFIAMYNPNRLKGFGLAILMWLLLAIIYDGLFLVLLSYFKDYPLENVAIIGTLLNPIDLSRIVVLLELDVAALMGYTGAVFKSFFGTGMGVVISSVALLIYLMLPIFGIFRLSNKMDF